MLGAWIMAAVLFALTLALDTRHNDFPYTYHPDEGGKVTQVLVGSRNYPSSPAAAFDHDLRVARLAFIPRQPQAIVQTGRWVSATFAAGSVAAFALLAWWNYGLLVGWGAGLAIALQEDLFEMAHYMKEDPALLFGLALALLAAHVWWRYPGRRSLRFLAIACGLAAAGKYLGIVADFLRPAAWSSGIGRAMPRSWPARARVKILRHRLRRSPFSSATSPLFGWQDLQSVPQHSPRDGWRGRRPSRPDPQGPPRGVSHLPEKQSAAPPHRPRRHLRPRAPRHRPQAHPARVDQPPLPSRLPGDDFLFPQDRRALPPARQCHDSPARRLGRRGNRTPPQFTRFPPPPSRQRTPRRRNPDLPHPLELPTFTHSATLASSGGDLENTALFSRAYIGFQHDDPTAVAEWIKAHVPATAIIAEDHRVNLSATKADGLSSAARVPQKVLDDSFAPDLGSLDEMRAWGVNYVAVCKQNYGRYFNDEMKPQKNVKSGYDAYRDFYARVFKEGQLVKEWPKGPIAYLQPGIKLYRIARRQAHPPHPPRRPKSGMKARAATRRLNSRQRPCASPSPPPAKLLHGLMKGIHSGREP